MDTKKNYSKDITANYPSAPKGFTETKDHYTGWFFKSLKSITTDKSKSK